MTNPTPALHWLDMVEHFKALVSRLGLLPSTGKPITVQDAPELFGVTRETLLDWLAAAARLSPESLREARNINGIVGAGFWVGIVKLAGIDAKVCASMQAYSHKMLGNGLAPTLPRLRTSVQILDRVVAAWATSDKRWREVFARVDAHPETIHHLIADGTLAPGGVPLAEDGLPITFSSLPEKRRPGVVRASPDKGRPAAFPIGPDTLLEVRPSHSAPGMLWVKVRFRFPYISGVNSKLPLPKVLACMMETEFARGRGEFVTHAEVAEVIESCSRQAKATIPARKIKSGKPVFIGGVELTSTAYQAISKIRSRKLGKATFTAGSRAGTRRGKGDPTPLDSSGLSQAEGGVALGSG